VSDHVDVPATAVTGVGGYVIRSRDGILRILQFLTVGGRVVNIALPEGLAPHVADKATEIALAEMETGEVMRDLGLYEQG
jgi:hypothetical protein